MKNVSYKRVVTNASAAADEITSRAKKSNKLYATSFILLAIVVILYITYSLSLTTYDGFMVSRNVSIRPSNNMVVVEYMVKPGDYVNEGDTLYSYVNVDWVNKAADPYYESQNAVRKNEATIRRDRLRSEYSKQIQTLDSLTSVVERAKEDVYLGVATKEYMEQLEWDMFIAKKETENTIRLIAIEQRAISEAGELAGRVATNSHSIGVYSHTDRINGREAFGLLYSHRVAYVDMLIVDIHARHGVLVMGDEPIITYMPYNNPEMLDTHAKMLLSPDQFSAVRDSMIFNVYAGKDYIGKVRTTYQSTFISDHNIQTQDKYERNYKQQDIVVRAEFLDKDCVYRKYQVDKYPLRLTRYKWGWLNKIMNRRHQRLRDNKSNELKSDVDLLNQAK
ncbi:MAG: hypothetical protein SNG38_07410 [Rikenellaceae bacterium]